MQTIRKDTPWFTVGVKLLIGVALASNCFIGTLLLINHRTTTAMEQIMASVLTIREQVDVSLRETIVRLQKEFVALPGIFAVDAKKDVLAQVERNFQIGERQLFASRDSYAERYSRTEKRDLANGQLVVRVDNNTLTLSRGLVDAQGDFTGEVESWHLVSTQPETDQDQLRRLIDAAQNQVQTQAGYEEKVDHLRRLAADKSIEAEKSRTEILEYVDQINLHEQRMAEATKQQRRFSLFVGLAAILANILVLFFLTRRIVEQPLHRLTSIIEALGAGQYPEVPWLNRRDQIGVLCSAIGRFREVLLTLKQEEERKEKDRQRIEGLVHTMTAAIHQLNDRAGKMATLSLSLQELAGRTEQASTNVAGLADDTAKRTDEVSASSQQISLVVGEIHRELGTQSLEEKKIVEEIARARRQLDDLSRSVAEIDNIVGAVHTITDQTKILAINATIEAVKAGEHGRGFGVVAEEVKKLSQNTAHATRDVLNKIEMINATCRSFIDSFDTLDQGAGQLHQVSVQIAQAVGRQRELTSAIVELTRATGANTQEVSSRIAEVNSAATGVLQLAADARRYAEEIDLELSELLQGSVSDLEAMSLREIADSEAAAPAPAGILSPPAPSPVAAATQQVAMQPSEKGSVRDQTGPLVLLKA